MGGAWLVGWLVVRPGYGCQWCPPPRGPQPADLCPVGRIGVCPPFLPPDHPVGASARSASHAPGGTCFVVRAMLPSPSFGSAPLVPPAPSQTLKKHPSVSADCCLLFHHVFPIRHKFSTNRRTTCAHRWDSNTATTCGASYWPLKTTAKSCVLRPCSPKHVRLPGRLKTTSSASPSGTL